MTQRALSTSILVLSCLAATAASAAGPKVSNPGLYEKSLRAAAQAYDHFGGVDDDNERRRVNDIGYRLAVVSDYDAFPFTFHLVDMPVPNAFALPGGHIFVTRGMLALGLDDDMLANLLGHELAHVIYEHGTKMQRRATLLNLLSTAALLGVLVGVEDDPYYDPLGRPDNRKGSMVQGTMAASMALSELLLRNYSREFEDEADVEGQRLAAAAGFDPAGAHQLWRLMNSRIPESQTYGYWRTHPFSEQRMRAAEVRAEELKVLQGRPAEDYRAAVQKLLLDERPNYGDKKKDEGVVPFLELSALHAWPQGPRAEELRLAHLHALYDEELEHAELERDYGELVRAYRVEIEEVRLLTPGTAFLATLEKELDALRDSAEKAYPKAQAVWQEGIYQTPFLETFLSNHPTAPEAPRVALALGDAYSRLRRETEAVEQYLRAAEAGPESEAGRRAIEGLRNLAPHLEKLAALEQLTAFGDDKLAELAKERLGEQAKSYKDIANGAEYLKRFPDGDHTADVSVRLEKLASNLYGEVVLYQQVGDHLKALDRIQKILTHAPFSQAAEMLRERAVFDS